MRAGGIKLLRLILSYGCAMAAGWLFGGASGVKLAVAVLLAVYAGLFTLAAWTDGNL